MIAVVSSTIKPAPNDQRSVSCYPFEERLKQTKLTLAGLRDCGFKSIFLVDNSASMDGHELEALLSDFPEVNIYHLQQYQFLNKGVNELLMMLFLIQYLPPNENIFKISGRYYPGDKFKRPNFADFAVKDYQYRMKNGTISTRGYWVKDAGTYHRFLLSCMDELFAYPERITGLKSLFRLLFVKKDVVDDPLNISIEFAAANVLKAGKYKVSLLDAIGIEGYIAGYEPNKKITE
ncbi:MAG: hypothetical protein ABI203_06690 [Mucilaginibacter sp.]